MASFRSWLKNVFERMVRVRFVGTLVLIVGFFVALLFLPFYILLLLFSSGWPRKLSSDEAREILTGEMDKLKNLTYEELSKYLEEETYQRSGASGTVYNVSVHTFAGRPESGEDLRVTVSVDDGMWGALCSIFALSGDFVFSSGRT